MVTALTSAVSAAPVCAQDAPAPDPPFAALAGRLRTGVSVRITETTGEVVKGHVAGLGPHHITVLVGEERHTVDAARLERVQRTRVGVLLGAIIGAGAGVAAGAALASLVGNEGGNTTAAFMVPVTIGVGTGVAIDGLINLPRTVYRRKPATRLSAAPILGAGAVGGLNTDRLLRAPKDHRPGKEDGAGGEAHGASKRSRSVRPPRRHRGEQRTRGPTAQLRTED